MNKSPLDSRDLFADSIYNKDIKVPDALYLHHELGRIRDQKNSSQCAAFAACTIKEWQERRDSGYTGFFRPEYIYDRRRHKNIHGMYGRDVMHVLKEYGALTASDFVKSQMPGTPNENEYAAKYKIKGYAQVRDIETLKRCLVKNGPCLINVPMYDKESKTMWIKPKNFTGERKGHAMVVVGYDKNGFLLRNSFGTDWGDDGYCYFPYHHWKQTPKEIWTVLDQDTNSSVSCVENIVAFFSKLCTR